ncbi:MAG: cyclic nucleotide-binding domain-containing protein, partial [Leptospiraceae bacterium]|nr:cyclic nucleotide-binding domain-containing protein [Leptospiraceae bacterium]
MSTSLEKTDSKELLDETISLDCKQGDVILSEGDFPNKTMYLLLQGELKVYKTRNNRLEEISQIREGEFFGESALISDQPRTATVKVVSESAKIIQFSKESFIQHSRQNPALVFSILKAAVARIFRAETIFEKLLKLSYNFSPELIIKLNQHKAKIKHPKVKEYLSHFKTVHYSKGDKVIVEGTLPLGYMYYVVSGNIRAVKNINGKTCYLNNYDAGSLFGEISFFSEMKSFASYYAVEESYLLYIDKKIFYKILEIHPEFIFEELQNFIWKLINIEKANQILKNQLEEGSKESDIRIYKKGDIILREGDPSNETMYYVLKGELNVYKNRGQNLELINLLTKGDFFGELSLISNQPRTATIEVNSEVAELVLFSKKKFIEQTKKNPNLMMSILKATIAKLLRAETSLSKILFRLPSLESDLKIRLDRSRIENIN